MPEYMIAEKKDGTVLHVPGARTATLVDRVLFGDWCACLFVEADTLEQAKEKYIARRKGAKS